MILFCDFDETIYFAKDPEKTAQNYAAIKYWKSLNHQFSIATGRSYSSLKNDLDPAILALCDYLIVDVGSLVYDGAGNLKDSLYIGSDIIKQIKQTAKSISSEPDITYFNVNGETTNSRAKNITKVRFWFTDEAQINTIDQKLQTQPLRTFQYTATGGNFRSYGQRGQNYFGMLEIISDTSGKENAINRLINLDQIPHESVITVGDGRNDFGMIQDFNGYLISNKHKTHLQDFNQIPSLHQLIFNLTS